MGADNLGLRELMTRLLQPHVQGRPVVLTGSAAQSHRMAGLFTDAGADRAVSIPIGGTPRETQRRFAVYEQALTHPDLALTREFERHDPEGNALVYAGSFTAIQTVLGRKMLGARHPAHADSERKDFQISFTASPGQIIDLADELHFPDSVVIQGIPDQSLAMAASHTYLIPGDGDRRKTDAVVTALGKDCSRATVRPLDRGIPCTFYGFLSSAWVVDLGPVGALVYWHRGSWRIHAPGIAHPLVLSEGTLKAAREAVRITAERLHAATGYVGAFGTDGVITCGQYQIHEINPRVCAGFSLLDEMASDVSPLAGVDLILREYGPDAAEALLPSLLRASGRIANDLSPWIRIWDQGRNVQSGLGGDNHDLTEWYFSVCQAMCTTDMVHLSDLNKESLG